MSQNKYLEIYRSLRRLGNQMHRLAIFEMQDEQLHDAQARLLNLLLHKNGSTQKELADAMGIRPASLTPLIQRLEEEGYIQRKPNPEDRRSTNVFLTEVGKKEGETLKTQREEYAEKIFSVLSDEEQETLLGLLKTLETEWRQLSEEQTDYLTLFLYQMHDYSQDKLEELFLEASLEYQVFAEVLESYQQEDLDMDYIIKEHRQRGYGKRCDGHGPERSRMDDQQRGHGHPRQHGYPEHRFSQGRGAHGRPHYGHPGHFADHPGHKRNHHGKQEGRGRKRDRHGYGPTECAHHMRHHAIRSGFNIEGLRRALEEKGFTQKEFKALYEMGIPSKEETL